MRTLSVFGLLLCFCPLFLSAQAQPFELEPEADSPWFGTGDQELSGLELLEDGITLLAVADGPTDHAIYQVEPKSNQRFALKPFLHIHKHEGYEAYRRSLDQVIQLNPKDRRHDFEGLARCGEVYFLADERVRKVIKLSSKSVEEVKLHLNHIKDLWGGSANAGFEGIAVDCEAQHLYLAKEREPRMLLKIDLKSGKVLKHAEQLPLSARDGQKVIDFRKGKGLVEINRDIADLVYRNGYLYLLERYTREIVKLHADSFKETGRVSYFFAEFGLYQSALPYGLAEGLTLTKDKIFVGIDHNQEYLSQSTTEKHGVQGAHSAILVFKRPKGF